MRRFVALLMKSKSGATAIEYGLIAALVAIAAIAGMQALGGSLNTTFQGVSDNLDNAIANSPLGTGTDSSTTTTGADTSTTTTSTGG